MADVRRHEEAGGVGIDEDALGTGHTFHHERDAAVAVVVVQEPAEGLVAHFEGGVRGVVVAALGGLGESESYPAGEFSELFCH